MTGESGAVSRIVGRVMYGGDRGEANQENEPQSKEQRGALQPGFSPSAATWNGVGQCRGCHEILLQRCRLDAARS